MKIFSKIIGKYLDMSRIFWRTRGIFWKLKNRINKSMIHLAAMRHSEFFHQAAEKSKSSLKFLQNSFASHLKHLIKPSKSTPVSHQSNRVLCIDPPLQWTSSPFILWQNLKSAWFTQSGSGSSTGIFGIFWEEWHACVWEQWKQLRCGKSVLEIFAGFWFW